MVGTKLFIGNLPNTVDKDELENMFKSFGNVVEFDILKDYGFVHYEKESEAKAACEAMDGQVHKGCNIRVEVSRSRVRQKAGMGGKGECFRCGEEGHWSKECPRGPSRGSGGDRRSGRGGSRGGGRNMDRYSPYARDPYYPPLPDPYDYYARARAALPSYAYDRYRMAELDRYERRLPPLPPTARDSMYRDFQDSVDADYYRRGSPPVRDPYYDYYERRRMAAADDYADKIRTSRSEADGSYPGGSGDMPMSRGQMSARVPGPY